MLVKAEQHLVEPGELQHLQAAGIALGEHRFCNGPEVDVQVDIQSRQVWLQCRTDLPRKLISVKVFCQRTYLVFVLFLRMQSSCVIAAM